MTTTINASTSSGLVTTPDNSGTIALQSNGTTIQTISATGVSSLGVTNGSSAAAGQVGEYVSSWSNAISVAGSGWTAMTYITLTAGDWDISGNVSYYGSSGSSYVGITINTTSGSGSGTVGINQSFGGTYSPNGVGQAVITRYRVNITSTTTYYLNATMNATNQCYGTIDARRMR